MLGRRMAHQNEIHPEKKSNSSDIYRREQQYGSLMVILLFSIQQLCFLKNVQFPLKFPFCVLIK